MQEKPLNALRFMSVLEDLRFEDKYTNTDH